MTRRGSLIYYLAAVVVGGLFLAISYFFFYFHEEFSFRSTLSREFFLLYFYVQTTQALTLLLFAFLLRRVCQALEWSAVWQWSLSAIPIFLFVAFLLGIIGQYLERAAQFRGWSVGPIFLSSPTNALDAPHWFIILPAVVLAVVLRQIHFAFERQTEPSLPAKPSQH